MANLNTPLFLATGGPGVQSFVGSPQANAAWPRAKEARPKERVIPILYVMTGTEAANDLLRLVKLYPGERVLAGRSKVVCEALGAAVTAQIGDTSNALRYSNTMTLTAIAANEFAATPGTDLYTPTDVVDTTLTGAADQTVPILKFITVTTPTAGKKLIIFLAVASILNE